MNEFFKRRKIVLATIAGSLLTLIAIVAIFFVAPTIVSAASGQAAATPTTTKTKVNYCTQYEQDLAKQLNISASTLAQDNKTALITVINQKVKDGKLTQAKADTLIKKVNSSKGNVCPNILTRKHTIGHAWLNKYSTDVVNQLAQGLHLTSSQLTAQFKAGKNLSQIATAQKVSASALQTLVKNTANSVLKTAVSAKTLTQAQANTLTTYIQKHPAAIQKLEAAIVKKTSAK